MDTYEDRYKFLQEEDKRLYKIIKDVSVGFAKTEQRFFELSAYLFSEEHTKFSSQIIPEKYHPWNVSGRVHKLEGVTAAQIYEEAINMYEFLLTPVIPKSK